MMSVCPFVLAGAGAGSDGPLRTSTVDESVTDLVYMDIGVCPEGLRQNRTLGDKSAICSTSEPLGRIVIGEAQLPLCTSLGISLGCDATNNRSVHESSSQ